MKLYYMPGACSLTIHIALEWIGQPFEIQKMDRESIKSPDYLKINPMGAVPAITDGDLNLPQNIAILSYLAAKHPEAALFGDGSAKGLAQTMRWLSFINSDLHRTFSLVFGPQRYLADAPAQAELAASAAKALRSHFTLLDTQLEGQDYLTGAKRTVADAYLFVVLRWAQAKNIDLSGLTNLPKFSARMKNDPAVIAALKAEGLE